MKRYLSVAAFTLLVGAGPARAQNTVSWWYGRGSNPQQQQALDRDLVQPFSAAHPDIRLNIEFRGSVVDRQIRIALLSGPCRVLGGCAVRVGSGLTG